MLNQGCLITEGATGWFCKNLLEPLILDAYMERYIKIFIKETIIDAYDWLVRAVDELHTIWTDWDMYQNVTFSLHTKKAIRMKQKWGDQSNGKLHNISQKKNVKLS